MALPEVKVRVTADTAQAEAGLSRVDKAVTTTASKTTAATAKTRGMSGAMGKLGSVSTTTRSRIQQTSFQLQDIIVQLQGGTKASTALSQQLPQMAGAFGAVGAAIGVGVALGIPAVALAMNALKGESEDLEARMENLADLSDALSGNLDTLSLSVAELGEKYGDAAIRVQEFAIFQSQLRIAELTAALAAQSEVISNVAGKYTLAQDAGRQYRTTLAAIERDFGITGQAARRFEDTIGELANAENFDSQVEALQSIQEQLDAAGVSASDIPPEFALALSKLIDLSRETDAARVIADQLTKAVAGIATEFSNAEGFAVLLNDAAGGLAESLAPGLAAAKSLADELWDAAKSLAIIESAGTQGRGGAGPGGPMGVVEQFLAGRDPSTRNRNSSDAPDAPSGRGQERDPAIEALLQSLKTEDEILEEWRATGLQTLAEANAEELAALGGHSEAKLRLEAEYQDRLNGIKRIGGAADLATTLGAGASILAAVGQHNDKAMRMAKVFSAAKALINTMEGASEALKLPFPANLAAAATVISSGMGFISAIKGVSSSGGGGGIPSAPSAPSIPSAPDSGGSGGGSGGSGGSGGGSPTNVSISLQGGDMFGRDQVIGLINSINEAVEDGAIVRLV
jgi:hypothetical protein